MRTYRFRIYPSDAQINMLDTAMELWMQLHNAMPEQKIYAYRFGRRVNYNSQLDELPELKNAFLEYRSIHSQVLHDAARRLDRAYDNFFRRVREKKMSGKVSAGAFTMMSVLQ